jgi:UDP-N-acetylglucosamine acyltransferase
MSRVHSSSIVSRNAEIADDVVVGPFCHVHDGVRIGAGTRLMSHVVVMPSTRIGEANIFHPFTVIGGEAQVRKAALREAELEARGRGAALEIGDHNVFREGVTVSVSSGEGVTSIGSHNLFMATSHIAHDVVVGSRCIVANSVQLAGHVVIEDWVTFGGSSGVAQHLRVGQGAFVAAGAMCERDVPPFVIVQGDRARVRALNVVGLERQGVSAESIAALRRAFALLWGRRDASFAEALRALDRSDPFVARLASWLLEPERSVKPARRLGGARG